MVTAVHYHRTPTSLVSTSKLVDSYEIQLADP